MKPATSTTTSMNESESCTESEREDDTDFNANESKKRKKRTRPKTVTIELPTDILKKTALTTARLGVSARAQTMLLANTVTSSDGDLQDIICSKSSANRYRNEMVNKKATTIRDEFSLLLGKLGKKFVIHFDGKLVQDLTDSTRTKRERLAVLLTSPEMESPQLLGVPPLEAGTAEGILDGIMKESLNV